MTGGRELLTHPVKMLIRRERSDALAKGVVEGGEGTTRKWLARVAQDALDLLDRCAAKWRSHNVCLLQWPLHGEMEQG